MLLIHGLNILGQFLCNVNTFVGDFNRNRDMSINNKKYTNPYTQEMSWAKKPKNLNRFILIKSFFFASFRLTIFLYLCNWLISYWLSPRHVVPLSGKFCWIHWWYSTYGDRGEFFSKHRPVVIRTSICCLFYLSMRLSEYRPWLYFDFCGNIELS